MQIQLECGNPQGSVRTRKQGEKKCVREQAFKVEMAATAEGFDGDEAFVGNHQPDEISCHVIVNSVIVRWRFVQRGSILILLRYATLHTFA